MIRSALDHAGPSFELLVGDASDRPGGFERSDPRVEVIREPEPLGYTRGFNALFRRARGRYVCFLNDDVELPPGWGAALLEAIRRHPEVELFCLPLIERGESEASILLCMGVPYACMGAVRREAGEALGWFDEGYGFYAADTDFSLRLIAAGRRLAPARGAHVFHHRADDAQRVSNVAHVERDRARRQRIWHPRRQALRRRYRRSSFRYFRALEERQSPTHRCAALVVPSGAQTSAARPVRTHRVRAPGWWLGL